MTTYRERREARADRLDEWADKRDVRATAASDAAHRIADMIPFGQPILVGHHSERGHRRDIARIDAGMRSSIDSAAMASGMRSRAENIRAAADEAIYSDDPDAVERLTEKIATLEAKRARMKTANAEYRRDHKAELKAMSAYERGQSVPYPSYALTNLGGVISNTRKRLAQLQREATNGPVDRVITARRGGACETCGAELERGQSIRYNRSNGARCYPACEEG